jgi:RNA polymerase sigma factor (sigma-70 family)
MHPTVIPSALEAALRAHERRLWGLCYRMTGSVADADDLVQETFARALEAPPRLDAPLEPWLTRVAMNLARDALRRRRRSSYPGPWLPAPVETGDAAAEVETAAEPASTEGRYDLLESVTFAFLLAIEALSPQQRAVLLLRDVFDYSVRETAGALGLSEANVKTTHLRARRSMAAYDAGRTLPTRTMQERNRRALEGLMSALRAHDVAGVERLLAGQVRYRSDGGGEFFTARVPVLGPKKVAALLVRLEELHGPPDAIEVRALNGFPGLLAWYRGLSRTQEVAPLLLRVEADGEGRIVEVFSLLAPRKLAGIGRGRGDAAGSGGAWRLRPEPPRE